MAGSRPPLVSSDCDDGTVTGRLLTMLAAAAAITGVLVAVVLLFVGVWHLLAAVYGTVSNRARAVPLRVGLAELLTAAALVTVPFATTGIAERDDWVDRDGNGFLDPFANGAYDWWDINGGRWIRAWGLSNALLGLAMWAATRWWRARGTRGYRHSPYLMR
jgi:hypothetical protein